MKETTTSRGRGSRDKSTPNKPQINSHTPKTDPQKVQPTAEQMRLAKMMGTEPEDPEIQTKIKQATELTGRSADDAITALHDCDYDLNRAVEQLLDLETDQCPPQGEWQEASSRKKKVPVPGKSTNGSDANHKSEQRRDKSRSDDNREFDGRNDSGYSSGRGRRNDRAPPRFQRGRGRDHNSEGDRGNESRSRDRGANERGRGRGRGSANGPGGRGRGRGGNRGGFGQRDRTSGEKFERGPQIDTWTNDAADKKEEGMGAWNDMESEDWTTDEWTGPLDDTKVFTASNSNSTDSSKVFSNNNDTSSNIFDSRGIDSFPNTNAGTRGPYEDSSNAFSRPPLQQNSLNVIGSQSPIGQNSLGTIGNNSMPVGQRLDLTMLLSKSNAAEPAPSASPSQSQSPYMSQYARTAAESIKNAVGAGSSNQQEPYMSQYAKEATESIKNAVGIGGTSAAPSKAPAPHQPSANRAPAPQMTNTPPPGLTAAGSPSPAQHQQRQQQHQQKAQRSKLPPPSKIPASAVEMPGEMSYKLDVQFGNLDYGNQDTGGFSIGGSSSQDFSTPVSSSSDDSLSASQGSHSHYNNSSGAAPGLSNQSSKLNSSESMSYPGSSQSSDHNSYGSQRPASGKPSQSPNMNFSSQNYSAAYSSSTYKPTTSSFSLASATTLSSSALSGQQAYTTNGNSSFQTFPSQSSSYSASSTQNSLYNSQTTTAASFQSLQSSSSSYAYHSTAATPSTLSSSKDSASDKNFNGAQYSAAQLSESLNKMTVKEDLESNQFSSEASTAGLSTATTTISNSLPSSNVGVSSALGLSTGQNSLSTSKTQPLTSTAASKPPPNLPPGVPVQLPQNYMIGQHGMPFAATFQPIQYNYEEQLQLLTQQRMPLPGYYDMPLQQASSSLNPSAQTAAGRSAASQDQSSIIAAAVNAPYSIGSETSKLPRVDAQSPVNAQTSAQQPSAGSQSAHQQQQTYISPATLPPSYNYYYPSAVLPGYSYTPANVFQLPSASNATHGTTATSQFQKPGAYGSHVTYGSAGQTQDFSKAYGGAAGSQSQPKGSVPAASLSSTGADLTGSNTGYGKTHSQSFDKSFHATGTPPPFNQQLLNAAAVTQAGAGLAQPPTGTYPAAAPYIPMVQHQPQSTHILHHPIQQDSTGSSRGSQQTSSAPKTGGSKSYSGTYWGAN